MPQRNRSGSGETGWAGPPFMSAKSFRLFTKIIFLMIAVPCEFPVVWVGNRKGENPLLFFNNLIKKVYFFTKSFSYWLCYAFLYGISVLRKTDFTHLFLLILFLSFEYVILI